MRTMLRSTERTTSGSATVRLRSLQGHMPVTSVLFVDDSAYMGGGALGLINYVEHEHAEVVFLRGGPLLARARAAGVPVSCLVKIHGRPGLYASLLPLWRVLRRSRHEVVVANSVRAAALIALVRPRRGRYVFYVHEEVSRASRSANGSWTRFSLGSSGSPRH